MTWSVSAAGKKADALAALDSQAKSASDAGAQSFADFAREVVEALAFDAPESKVSITAHGHSEPSNGRGNLSAEITVG